MSEVPKPQSEIDAYFGTLDLRLSGVPELRTALDYAVHEPEYAAAVYESYVGAINCMANLSEHDQQVIAAVKNKMLIKGESFGTASQVSAADILVELGAQKDNLSALAMESTNPASPYFEPAMDELVTRLEGGHQLKVSGKIPSDDDPESKKVIWGHTIITEPKALINFIVCHYLERYFAEALTAGASEVARHKDFLLNALIDTVILDSLKTKQLTAIFEIWSTPKDQGGLGWIAQSRVDVYKEVTI